MVLQSEERAGSLLGMREAIQKEQWRAEAEEKTQQIREQEEIIRRQADKINHQEEEIRAQASQIHVQQEEIAQFVQQLEELGGQKGHEGKTLSLVANPDLVVLHEVEVCDYCHSDLQSMPSIRDERRQVINLPVKRTVVTEHESQSKCCPRCQTITVAPFPADVKAPVQYGADVGAAAVYLSSQQLQPIGRTAEIFSHLFDCPISGGSIQAMIDRCALALCGIEEQIKQALRAAKVIHNDETGCYVAGKRQWGHSCSTETLTHYAIHVKRGREATDAIGILLGYTGTSIHDGWTSYWKYLSCQHGLCNVHHLRELTYQAEEKKQKWAADLIQVLLEMKEAVEQA